MMPQSLIVFVCLLGFVRAAIPFCTEGDQQPELPNGQKYCFFANYSRDVPAIEFHGQSLIDIQVVSDLKDIRVNEDRVLWTANIQLDMQWSDNRILMDPNTKIITIPMSVAEEMWFPTLVSDSNQLVSMDKMASKSLALSIINGDVTSVNVIFEEVFINKCPDMSFWTYPFDRFSCTFYLRHRDLPFDMASINGTVHPRPELWTPSKIDFTAKDAKSDDQTINYLNTNYSTTGFIIEFQRKQAYYFSLYYAPLIMFVIASFASFTIPPLDGNDRTCMIVTLFLINVQMSLYITDQGPNADSSTALDSFVNASTGFIFLAIVEYLIILKRLSKYRNNKDKMEYEKALQFAKKLDYYASMLFPVAYILYLIYHFIYYEFIAPNSDFRAGLSKLTL